MTAVLSGSEGDGCTIVVLLVESERDGCMTTAVLAGCEGGGCCTIVLPFGSKGGGCTTMARRKRDGCKIVLLANNSILHICSLLLTIPGLYTVYKQLR